MAQQGSQAAIDNTPFQNRAGNAIAVSRITKPNETIVKRFTFGICHKKESRFAGDGNAMFEEVG